MAPACSRWSVADSCAMAGWASATEGPLWAAALTSEVGSSTGERTGVGSSSGFFPTTDLLFNQLPSEATSDTRFFTSNRLATLIHPPPDFSSTSLKRQPWH